MCTVTIVRFGASDQTADDEDPGGSSASYRLISNRDELRTRGRALGPRICEADGVRAMMPRDLDAGGTWIAAAEHGLVMTLLNVNPRTEDKPAGPPATRSRGHIIPMLLGCTSLGFIESRLHGLAVEAFRPFRLIALLDGGALEARSDGRTLHCTVASTDQPLFYTSSGLGDHLVEAPRRKLFEATMLSRYGERGVESVSGDAMLDEQRAFHRHAWPDRPHLSVCMSRDDACTVSCTEVDVLPDRIVMRYLGDPPTAGSQRRFSELSLKRRPPLNRPVPPS